MGEWYKEDSELKNLLARLESAKSEYETKRESLEEQIITRKRIIFREKGLIIDSINQLVCTEHPKATFNRVGEIPGCWESLGSFGAGRKALYTYQCEQCGDNKAGREYNLLTHLPHIRTGTVAYDCPKCGIVVGEYNTMVILEDTKSYHCAVCDCQIGSEKD